MPTRQDARSETHLPLIPSSRRSFWICILAGRRAGRCVRADGFDYIETFYNPTRRRSPLGYLSPACSVRRAGAVSLRWCLLNWRQARIDK